MIEDFVHRFKTTADALMSHPSVRVTHVWIGPPARDEDLSQLAMAWGHPVPATLARLYRQADGLQLRWVDTAHETYDPERDDRASFARSAGALYELRGGAPAGLLDLPPIELLAGRDSIAAELEPYDETLARAFAFDSFGESQDAVLHLGDGADDPWVSLASDHLADVDPPGERTLSQYLDHVLSTWASVWYRRPCAPRRLDAVLRRRFAVDPPRLVGQRVMYYDEGRGHALVHGHARSLVDVRESPSWWPFARTLVEVGDDLGETLYVPLRCVFRPDQDDPYERLWADRTALRAVLEGPARALFEHLAPVTEYGSRQGIGGGPALADAAWPYAGLCASDSAEQAVHSLVVAVHTLVGDAEDRVERAVAWPPTGPRGLHRNESCFATLAAALLDAVVVLVARRGGTLTHWVRPDTATRLRHVLARLGSNDPLRGYDPRTDPSTGIGALVSALAGKAPSFTVAAPGPLRGTSFGLPDLRVVCSASNEPPA